MLYTKMTNQEILANINGLVDEWRNQFDNPPEESPVTFTVTDCGLLCANGTVLFPLRDVCLDSLSYELEAIYLGTCSGQEYEIGFNWPVAAPPHMSFIKRTDVLYAAP